MVEAAVQVITKCQALQAPEVVVLAVAVRGQTLAVQVVALLATRQVAVAVVAIMPGQVGAVAQALSISGFAARKIYGLFCTN
jgi:hypothetical protein